VLLGARQQRTLALTTRLVDGILGLVVFHVVRTAKDKVERNRSFYACSRMELLELTYDIIAILNTTTISTITYIHTHALPTTFPTRSIFVIAANVRVAQRIPAVWN
jgi:hypothetical protein